MRIMFTGINGYSPQLLECGKTVDRNLSAPPVSQCDLLPHVFQSYLSRTQAVPRGAAKPAGFAIYGKRRNAGQQCAYTVKNIRRYFVESFPHFNGTGPYTFVSVNRRNNELRAHIATWAHKSLFRGFTDTNVHGKLATRYPRIYGYLLECMPTRVCSLHTLSAVDGALCSAVVEVSNSSSMCSRHQGRQQRHSTLDPLHAQSACRIYSKRHPHIYADISWRVVHILTHPVPYTLVL